MKKKETTQHNIEASYEANNGTVQYKNYLTGEDHYISLDRLADEMIAHVSKEKKCYSIGHFRRKKGILKSSFDHWLKRSEKLKIFYDEARDIIGDRLNAGAHDRKMPDGHVRFQLPLFQEDWKELHEFHKNKNDQNLSPETVAKLMNEFIK